MAKRTRVEGGQRLERFIRANKHAAREQPEMAVGFKGHVVPLAALLEFGDPDKNLPERPAFRQGLRHIADELPAKIEAAARANLKHRPPVLALTEGQAREIAIWARDILRASYQRFRGPGLSERQEARKVGTKGADKELVGHEGPKLVEHVKAYVNGAEVG